MSSAVLLLGLASTAVAQDLIFYPFAKGSGTSVLNLAPGAPQTGTLVNSNTTNNGWAKGVGGGFALAGKDAAGTLNYVDTGFNRGSATSLFTGSFTIAFFMKEAWAQTSANSLAYFISGVGSFRMFTGGVAYEGLYLRVWGGAPADLKLLGPTNKVAGQPFLDLRAAAKKGWVHIALVVDSVKSVATYYVNGSPFTTIVLTTPSAAPTGSGNLKVGMHTSTSSGSNYDLDDFRLTNRAAPAHEIQQWANAKLRADKTQVSISAPGSQKLTLNAGLPQAGRLYWIFGSVTGTWPQVPIGPVNIPLVPDPYTHITIGLPNTPMLTSFRGQLGRSGQASASFNIPKNAPAAAIGVTAYHAFAVYDASGTVFDASNAAPIEFVK
ncbi:MAG: LamG-like jellyroll fold domain-containing protein [Planctomycetota bacterium]